jgi:hypothetical protein
MVILKRPAFCRAFCISGMARMNGAVHVMPGFGFLRLLSPRTVAEDMNWKCE